MCMGRVLCVTWFGCSLYMAVLVGSGLQYRGDDDQTKFMDVAAIVACI